MIDWTVIISAFLGTIPLTITAVASLLKVIKVEKNTNSMKDALVAATRAEALQAGRAEGKASEKLAAVNREGSAAAIAAGVAEVNQRVAEHDAWERERDAAEQKNR